MSVDSKSNLVELIRQARLLAPAQMEELAKVLVPRFPDPRALAKELLTRNWLTPYQVNQLLQAGGKDLVLGPYNLLQRLDDTYLGQVFKGRHQHMMRLAALTIVRQSLLSQPGAVEKFYQEIQSASRLTHAHILCAFDAGPIGRTHFFAMEYIEGTDLDRLVKESGPLPPALAAALVRQTALGLQHAYQRKLLHHDLRPANLLIACSDADRAVLPDPGSVQLKIRNLGLTLLRPRQRSTGKSSTDLPGPAADSTDYVAPEQAAGAPLTDVRSNLFSLGCIFYYLLAGRSPFAGGDSTAKQRPEPEPIEAFRNDVPGVALDVLARFMAKRPEDRYATPDEAAKALAAVVETGDKSGVSTIRIGGPRPNRRKWLPWAGAAAALLATGLVAAALFTSSGSRTETAPATAAPPPVIDLSYRKGPTRDATIRASLKASGYPNLEGKWYYIGPFDNPGGKGFDAVYPPEKEIDLKKTYPGKGGATVGWKEFPDFALGTCVDLKRFKSNDHGAVYVYHSMESARTEPLPISFGSDDTLTVWGNGRKLVVQNEQRGCSAGQAVPDFPLRQGKNELLIKVCQGTGDWKVFVNPRWPANLEARFGQNLRRDFPAKK